MRTLHIFGENHPPPAALHSGAARETFQRCGGVWRESGVHRRL